MTRRNCWNWDLSGMPFWLLGIQHWDYMAIITTFSGNKGPSSQQSIKNVLTKKLFPCSTPISRLQNAAANQSSCNLCLKTLELHVLALGSQTKSKYLKKWRPLGKDCSIVLIVRKPWFTPPLITNNFNCCGLIVPILQEIQFDWQGTK